MGFRRSRHRRFTGLVDPTELDEGRLKAILTEYTPPPPRLEIFFGPMPAVAASKNLIGKDIIQTSHFDRFAFPVCFG